MHAIEERRSKSQLKTNTVSRPYYGRNMPEKLINSVMTVQHSDNAIKPMMFRHESPVGAKENLEKRIHYQPDLKKREQK